jgi:hypothetical protein
MVVLGDWEQGLVAAAAEHHSVLDSLSEQPPHFRRDHV